jgi:hypothetical protein
MLATYVQKKPIAIPLQGVQLIPGKNHLFKINGMEEYLAYFTLPKQLGKPSAYAFGVLRFTEQAVLRKIFGNQFIDFDYSMFVKAPVLHNYIQSIELPSFRFKPCDVADVVRREIKFSFKHETTLRMLCQLYITLLKRWNSELLLGKSLAVLGFTF